MRKFYIGFLKYARSRDVCACVPKHQVTESTFAHVHKFCVIRVGVFI